MPEGPEVRKNVDYLNSVLKDTIIVNIKINSGRYAKHGPFEGFNLMQNNQQTVKDICCKGKFIYFNFESGGSLWSTLGMSGVWQGKETNHTRVTLINNKGQSIYYNDIRNFGTLKYTEFKSDLEKKLKSLGPDVLNTEVDSNEIRASLLKKPSKTIAENLMNQSLISGVGNYLKAEILYKCGISPHRLCEDINEKEYELLADACYHITRLSYKMGGATLSTYRQPNGKKGLYSRRFAVYNQKVAPCGNKVVKEKTLDKRTTHWVPTVQK
tara:strand:- start:480 stop:1286 length:807 start_codon:yes stop_codon:yes gene_type:complete